MYKLFIPLTTPISNPIPNMQISVYEQQSDEYSLHLDDAVTWLHDVTLQLKEQSQMSENLANLNTQVESHKVAI